MMSIIIFTGPTLSPIVARQYLAADYRPPAKQGDIYRASLEQPKIIAIIDGYFENVPAVWHKEILFAMSKGIHVFGCSSMGAIRAAELDVFGMQGIGKIYQQFADGILEDDDEVALLHAPPQVNYQPLSEAMVNIRATLHSAVEKGVIGCIEADNLISLAKSTWYPKRSYQRLLTDGVALLSESQHQKLSGYIAEKAVNVKREDAIQLLQYLANQLNIETLAAKTVDYVFAETDAWGVLVEQVQAQQVQQQMVISSDELALELKLQAQYHHLRGQAQARLAAIEKAEHIKGELSDDEFKHTLLKFSDRLGVIVDGKIDFDALSNWLKAQHLDMEQFDRLLHSQGKLNRLNEQYPQCESALLDILRLNHELGSIYNRVIQKRQLAAQQDRPLQLDILGITIEQLWQWYFAIWLGQPQPKDLSHYALMVGFEDLDTMRQAVLVQYAWFHRQ